MRRRDLPEIEDQMWCPEWLRNAMTNYLQKVIEVTVPYKAAAPTLSALLVATRASDVLDLASGAGGPWPGLATSLRASGVTPNITLTDLKPNRGAVVRFGSEPGFAYLPVSMSALDIGADLPGTRTMFSALHHFDRTEVRTILVAAQRRRVGFVACEATHRSWTGLLTTVLIPLLVLLVMPLVKPRRPIVLLLTYFPPIIPLLIWWDGVASTLRTHSASELRAITDEIAADGYVWRVDELTVSGSPLPMTQVVGTPA